MRRFIILIILPVALYQSIATAQEPLRVITDAWPPYVIENGNGKPSGIFYDIAREVFEEIGYDMTLAFCPWERCLKYIETLKADAVLGVDKADEIEEIMFLPEEPFLNYQIVFFYKNGIEFDFTGPQSLTGKTVGIYLGYDHLRGKEFRNVKGLEIINVPGYEQCIKMLLSGRLDLIAGAKAIYLYTAQKMGLRDDIGYSKNSLNEIPNHMGFAHKDRYEDLARKFSEALKIFKQTERYSEICSRYLEAPTQ